MLKDTERTEGTSEMTSERVNTESKKFDQAVYAARMNATLTGRTFYIFASDRTDFHVIDSGTLKGAAVFGIIAKVDNTGRVWR